MAQQIGLVSDIIFWVKPLSPLCLFVTFSVNPSKLVKIGITETVVVTVEALVLGRLDAVVQVTAKDFKKGKKTTEEELLFKRLRFCYHK